MDTTDLRAYKIAHQMADTYERVFGAPADREGRVKEFQKTWAKLSELEQERQWQLSVNIIRQHNSE